MSSASAVLRETLPAAGLERLFRALDRLEKLYGDLLRVAARKRDALIALDVDQVRRCTQAEELLADRIRTVEAARRTALEALASEVAGARLRGSETPLQTLLALVTDEQGAELLDRRRRLTRLSGQLAKCSTVNRALCDQALRQTNAILEALTGTADGQHSVYSQTGTERHLAARSLLDRTA